VFRLLTTRLLYTIPVLWLVVSVVFLLIHLVPGDPIQQMLGEGAAAADIEAARHAYGLDVPIGRQYLNYWKGVLHGELGQSLRFNQSVSRLITERYPFTMKLTLASLPWRCCFPFRRECARRGGETAGTTAPSASSACSDSRFRTSRWARS
jgi:peptide/nickel transport system permease protein